MEEINTNRSPVPPPVRVPVIGESVSVRQEAVPVPIRMEGSTLTFFDALKEAAEGKKITRVEWSTMECYGYLKESRLKIHKENKDFDWIISDGDILGTDWIILN